MEQNLDKYHWIKPLLAQLFRAKMAAVETVFTNPGLSFQAAVGVWDSAGFIVQPGTINIRWWKQQHKGGTVKASKSHVVVGHKLLFHSGALNFLCQNTVSILCITPWQQQVHLHSKMLWEMPVEIKQGLGKIHCCKEVQNCLFGPWWSTWERCWNYEISSLHSHKTIFKSSQMGRFLPVRVPQNQSGSPEEKKRQLREGLNCDKNRRLLQACKQRRPQPECCNVGSFVIAGQHFLVKSRAKRSNQKVFSLLVCSSAHRVSTPRTNRKPRPVTGSLNR